MATLLLPASGIGCDQPVCTAQLHLMTRLRDPAIEAAGHSLSAHVPIAGRRDEAQQVPGDLPAAQIPRDERRITELQEDHGVVQVTRQVPVAPEALDVPQDLSQVCIAYTLDSDIAHEHRGYHASALTARDPRQTSGVTH